MPGTNVPTITNGSTPATITLPGGKRQFRLQNVDYAGGAAIDLSWNDSGGKWRLQPGEGLGLYVEGGVVTITLDNVTTPAAYQLLLYP